MRARSLAIAVAVCLCCRPEASKAQQHAPALRAAVESIRAEDLQRHVNYLAHDALEGREAGTRGGRLAAEYLRSQLARMHIPGGVAGGGFDQPFSPGFSNILAVKAGSEPGLTDQVVIVCAHYDHVGHGTEENSRGPIGQVHNGADDNASGTSAVLELAHAFTRLDHPPKRSVLFAFWDAEEKEMLGSQYWTEHPTIPLDRVAAVINLDMIGRLRDNRLTVYGSRTACGFRRLVSRQNLDVGLSIDFSWELENDADHYPFFKHGLPVLFMHTGVHDEWHSPRDDAALIDSPGMERVTRLVFQVLYDLAQRPDVPEYRQAAEAESARALERAAGHAPDSAERTIDRSERPAARPSLRQEPRHVAVRLDSGPLRLGIRWRADDAEPGTVVLTQVVPGSPAAAAGLRPDDRIYQVGGHDFADERRFAELIHAPEDQVELRVERDGQIRTVVVRVRAALEKRAA